jgi:hypothetical protein
MHPTPGVFYEISGLPTIDEFFHETYGFYFIQTCAATLIQMGLKVRLKLDKNQASFVVDSVGEPLIRHGQYLFPPLFFSPYENSELLRFDYYPLNERHAFSEWLITYSDTINDKYPGIFKSIRNRVSKYMSYDKAEWVENIRELNDILERLWELDETLRPEKNILLEMDDFNRSYVWKEEE